MSTKKPDGPSAITSAGSAHPYYATPLFSWSRRADSSTGGVSDTSAPTFDEAIVLRPTMRMTDLETALADIEAHSRRALTKTPDEAQYGERTIALIEAVRRCLKSGDVLGLAWACIFLGQRVHDWYLKDLTEIDRDLGIKNVRARREARKARARKEHRRSPAARWQREVEQRRGGTLEAAYARIERAESLQPGTVKRALMRRRKALREK